MESTARSCCTSPYWGLKLRRVRRCSESPRSSTALMRRSVRSLYPGWLLAGLAGWLLAGFWLGLVGSLAFGWLAFWLGWLVVAGFWLGLVGFWLASGWLLAGFWLASGWLLAGFGWLGPFFPCF